MNLRFLFIISHLFRFIIYFLISYDETNPGCTLAHWSDRWEDLQGRLTFLYYHPRNLTPLKAYG
jgi:hypothetical protein